MSRKRDEIRFLQEGIKSSGTSFASLNSVSEEDMKRQLGKAKKLLAEDESQTEHHNTARDMFLRQAIEMYSQSLCSSDHEEKELAIRLCSLWYSNFSDSTYAKDIDDAIKRIPSYQFIFLAHQLTARLSNPANDDQGTSKTLRNLIMRLCEEHPFHILTQIFSLRQLGPLLSGRSQSSISSDQSQTNRQKGALDIFNRVCKQGRSAKRAKDLEILCNASLEWATHTLPKNDKGGSVPLNAAIRKIRDLKVPVMTIDLPVDLSTRYDNFVHVQRYSTKYKIMGGINLPKVMECTGSDGQIYKQLVCEQL